MSILIDEIFWKDFNGEEHVDEDYAVAYLLENELAFINFRRYFCPTVKKLHNHDTVVVFVNTSDTFAWGVSDAEDIRGSDDLKRLMKQIQKYGKYGVEIWTCLKNYEQPQRPVKEAMQKAGAWTDELEALPENEYDAFCREYFSKKQDPTFIDKANFLADKKNNL